MASKASPYNVNVGVLGHVDSGKTSLVAALSTKLSTAALDKHPQSKERGITLDLGFSAFTLPMPPRLAAHRPQAELQFTLVDCPGHASLIRTIIGGVQIIDMAILVIDVTKGIQAQTAECLVVAEMAVQQLVVVLNKVDLLPLEDRDKALRKAQKRLAQTFNLTKFAGVAMVPCCARPNGAIDRKHAAGASAAPAGASAGAPSTSTGAADGQDAAAAATTAAAAATGLEQLVSQLISMVPTEPPQRPPGAFLFAVDHCFQIKGQGTVLTGTVLRGSVAVNDVIELPAQKVQRSVKSMQMFRQPVQKATAGDRVGICVTQLDADLIERGLAAAPGSVPAYSGVVAAVEKVRFFAGRVASKAKFHVSIGHSTVMAEALAFGLPDGQGVPPDQALQMMLDNLNALSLHGVQAQPSVAFSMDREYLYQEELYGLEGRPLGSGSEAPGAGEAATSSGGPGVGGEDAGGAHFGQQWLLLKFDQPVTAPADAMVIGARFDADAHAEGCRLAFYGRAVATLSNASDPAELRRLKLFKLKERSGVLDRIQADGTSAICRGLLKKESDVTIFTGLTVRTGRGEVGTIEGAFGKSGKTKLSFPSGLAPEEQRSAADNVVTLRLKRFVHAHDSRRQLRQ